MNIAHLIREQARLHPNKKAVIHPVRFGELYHDTSITFKEFETRSNQVARKLEALHIKKGERVLLFIKPKIDFTVITFALFKIGAIPVLIDPGMGVKSLLSSIAQVAPSFMIAEPEVFLLKFFKRKFFKSLKGAITPKDLTSSLKLQDQHFEIIEVHPSDTSCILFTSGGTGIPKGVISTHGILHAQTKMLQEMFHLTHDDVDLPGFSLFALFTLSMGMTSIIPDMDPTKPALSDPKKLIPLLLKYGVTFAAGSPAIWQNVGSYADKNKILFPSLKNLVMFGAPVRGEVHELWQPLLPNGTTYTPYGATEALPLTLISGSFVLKNTWQKTKEGAGVCVGKPVLGVEIKIIKITDDQLSSIDGIECKAHEPGEIIVSGKNVTRSYFNMESETIKSKIFNNGVLWHRMGDMGYLDSLGQLWFLGRKSHRVEIDGDILYPISLEALVNQFPKVKRSALIKVRKHAAIVIEPLEPISELQIKKMLELLKRNPITRMIEKIFIKESFPVDVRHQIKIDRIKLANEFSKDNR